ncbi:MAG: hypothetical protein ACLPY5_05600 [Candidatus Bathyarchaeia archaeon]
MPRTRKPSKWLVIPALCLIAFLLGGCGIGFVYVVINLGSGNTATIIEILLMLIFIILGLGLIEPFIKKKIYQQIETGKLLLVTILCILGCLFGIVLILVGALLWGGACAVIFFSGFVLYFLRVVWKMLT